MKDEEGVSVKDIVIEEYASHDVTSYQLAEHTIEECRRQHHPFILIHVVVSEDRIDDEDFPTTIISNTKAPLQHEIVKAAELSLRRLVGK